MADEVITGERATKQLKRSAKDKTKDAGVYWSVGRRKTSVARVRMVAGQGDILINEKQLEDYCPEKLIQARVVAPLELVDRLKTFDISVKVVGGGKVSQAEAIAHGVARALLQYDEMLRSTLKQGHLLTRDPRMKERKKYGLKRARKAPQFSKR